MNKSISVTEKSIIKSIIDSYSGWDEEGGEYGDIQLYDVVLSVDTPKFKRGDKVDCITFLFSKSICQIWQKTGPQEKSEFIPNGIVDEFPIKLSIDIK